MGKKKITNPQKSKLMLILQALLNCVLALVMFGLPLFLPALTLRFWNAWLFLAVFILSMLAILLYLLVKDPKLMENRMRGDETEQPQKIVMTFLVLSALLTLVVSGFDFRLHWSKVPLWVVLLATAVMIGGFVMLFFVTRRNSFASRVIEVQKKQKLIDTGLYSIVRHPMYLAFTAVFIAVPFMLGSFLALIPAIFIPFLISFRIRNEEEVLRKGLKGYSTYMKKVKYRMIPSVW